MNMIIRYKIKYQSIFCMPLLNTVKLYLISYTYSYPSISLYVMLLLFVLSVMVISYAEYD